MKSTTLVQLCGAGWVLSPEGPLTPVKYGAGNKTITVAAAYGRAELARETAASLLDAAARLETLAFVALRDADTACPGCGCHPGEGRTAGCADPDGCGHHGFIPDNPNPSTEVY